MVKRIMTDIGLVLAAFLLPWWVVFITIFILAFILENYYEALIAGIIIDTLYGSRFVLWNFPLMITSIFFIIILGIEQFKKQLNV